MSRSRPAERFSVPAGWSDQARRRTRFGRMLRRGSHRRIRTGLVPAFNDRGEELDHRLEIGNGGRLRLKRGSYVFSVTMDRIQMSFGPRRGGSARLTVTRVGSTRTLDLPLLERTAAIDPSIAHAARWDIDSEGLMMRAYASPEAVRLEWTLASSSSAADLRVRIERDAEYGGVDGIGQVEALDADGREAEVRVVPGDAEVAGDGTITQEYRFTVTGRYRAAGGGWRTGATYPIVVDPSVSDEISDGGDDARVVGTTFKDNGTTERAGLFGGALCWAGFRHTPIAIPPGATISSATLTLELIANAGTPNLIVHGDLTPNGGQWSVSDAPDGISETTASTDWAPTGTGSKEIDITAIVQELVNDANWASGNAMRFVVSDQKGGGGSHYVNITSLEHASGDPSFLEITFAASLATHAKRFLLASLGV